MIRLERKVQYSRSLVNDRKYTTTNHSSSTQLKFSDSKPYNSNVPVAYKHYNY